MMMIGDDAQPEKNHDDQQLCIFTTSSDRL